MEERKPRTIDPNGPMAQGLLKMLKNKQLRRQNDPNDVTLEVIDSILFRYEDEVEGWDELSVSQQTTLKTAIEESNHPENLVPHEDVLKMMDKMLTE
jgi:hypothetical protein